jgi:nucleoside-diphosphate-sugar epimerase
MKKILVTGATGFVGRPLCRRMLQEGWHVQGALRAVSTRELLPAGVGAVLIGPIGPGTQWTQSLEGVETIVHLAGRTHVMREEAADPLAAYRLINKDGTEQLAREAATAGVKRLVYLSSVKVNGGGRERPYTESDAPAPEDGYGRSKWEAEQALIGISAETGMEVVILRPPLVYGPGVKANFLRLLQVIDLRIPMPFSRIRNLRSLISVENLIDALMLCVTHREAAGKTYLVSDGENVSTPDLIRRIAAALGRRAYLMPFPLLLLRLAGKVSGKTSAIERVLGSLTVSSEKIRHELGWSPPYTMETELRKTAEWFKKEKLSCG